MKFHMMKKGFPKNRKFFVVQINSEIAVKSYENMAGKQDLRQAGFYIYAQSQALWFSG